MRLLMLLVLLIVVDVVLRLLYQLVEYRLRRSGRQLLLSDARALLLLLWLQLRHLLLHLWLGVTGRRTNQSLRWPEVVVAMLDRQLLLMLLVLIVDARLLVVSEQKIRRRSGSPTEVAFPTVIRTGVAHRWGEGHHLTLDTLGIMLLQNVSSLVFVLRTKGHMNARVAVELLGVRVDNGPQRGGLNGGQWSSRVLDHLLFLLLLVVVVVQRGNGRFQMQLVVLILFVVNIEHMDLLLLLLFLGNNRLCRLLG